MPKIKIALAGVGNCASALVQGIEYYQQADPAAWPLGLMHQDIGGCGPGDIEVVAAFDVDARKVDRPLHEAIFAPPNCCFPILPQVSDSPVTVLMGPARCSGAPSHTTTSTRSGRDFDRTPR